MSGIFRKAAIEIALDWSDGMVKFARLRRDRKGLALVDMDAIPTGPGTDKDIIDVLSTLVLKHRLDHDPVILNMPRHLVTKRMVKLPSHVPEELRSMAQLQAIKELPYSKDEIIVDFRVIRLFPDGFADVLLVLAQRKSVESYLAIAKAAGIVIERIVLSSEGLLCWYISAGLPKSDEVVALIDVDRLHTHMQIMKGVDLIFSRSVSFDSASPDANRPLLINELRMSFDAYAKEGGESPERIYLCGAADHEGDLLDGVTAAFSLPVEHVVQLSGILPKGSEVAFQAPLSRASFCCLLGALCLPENMMIDLLPGEIRSQRGESEIKRAFAATGVLVLLIFLTMFAVFEKQIFDKERLAQQLSVKMKELSPESKRLSERLSDIRIIDDQLTFHGSSIDILRELYGLTPEDVSLAIFEYEAGNRVVLRGTASELRVVFEFRNMLEKSDYFENVKVGFATKRKMRNQELADFELIVPLAGAAEEG